MAQRLMYTELELAQREPTDPGEIWLHPMETIANLARARDQRLPSGRLHRVLIDYLVSEPGVQMHAFSGAILGSEHEAALPTVAQIEGDFLILSSPGGPVGEWPLDRVKIIEVGNGFFEVVAEDRRLTLVVDEPEAFEEALEAERVQRTLLSEVKLDSPEELHSGRRRSSEHSATSTGLFRRRGSLSRLPRHGRASIRPLPFTVAVAAVVTLSYLAGSFLGDLLNVVTTESPEVVQTPPAEVVVRTFQGSGDGITSAFVVREPWEVRWSYEAAEDARLEVLLLAKDGGSNAVAVQDGPGSGAVPLREPGIYRLEMLSTTDGEWTVSVVQVANADSG